MVYNINRDRSQCPSASAEKTKLFMMANATPSTEDAMVQTDRRSPTESVLLVAVKPSTQPWRPTSRTNNAQSKIQLKSKAAKSDMSTKRIVAQTVSRLDFESRTKL